MPERDLLVRALVAEVLGPREGAWEHLTREEDPLDEYITGVLAPRQNPELESEPDAEDESIAEDEPRADDQDDPEPASLNLGLTVPALDPRSRPASLGISFTMQSESSPRFDLCCTWARYVEDEGWRRSPRLGRWDGLACESGEVVLHPEADPGVEVIVRTRPRGHAWRVSVFLVNSTQLSASHRAQTEAHVFQPQIRVRLDDGAQLVPADDTQHEEDLEEATLAFLYRHHRSLARGHLCAAIWRDLDPERPVPGEADQSDSPFKWIDGVALLSEGEMRRFSPADVRSEYTPMIPVPTPERTWHVPDHVPELSPENLCELWRGEEMHRALQPLLTGYAAWIEALEVDAREGPADERGLAERQLGPARGALSRMTAGVELLRGDDDVRLAFCLANRAIAIQSTWARGSASPWYPFQLAFQLINLPAVASDEHPERDLCDLLWFPTGGGKTEAYLGLAAFVLAHRRLRCIKAGKALGGAGTAVLSRYTLRLLTIQQFRRALSLVTALEVLRVEAVNGAIGWRPSDCVLDTDHLWGRMRFSIGLWVGGNVTPNQLQDIDYRDRQRRAVHVPGAISLLEGRYVDDTEPAQVIACPACATVLALPPVSASGEQISLLIPICDAAVAAEVTRATLSTDSFTVNSVQLVDHGLTDLGTLKIQFTPETDASPQMVDGWITSHVKPQLGERAWILSARASRPGYIVRVAAWGQRAPLRDKPIDFEIYCPNPECHLNRIGGWSEDTPTGAWQVPTQFRQPDGSSHRCPIPAYTVDEQVYHRCPSMVIATVDKFARLPFEPRASALFGNVDRFNEHLGYYREWCPPMGPSGLPGAAASDTPVGSNVAFTGFSPPDLILQDELHLIEGPLGSMVGLYETAIEALTNLARTGGPRRPKYVASTATVRRAGEQVRSLFMRELRVFPPPGLTSDDSFFARTTSAHPVESTGPGRLHVGICAPGRGAQTPTVRIWARLLQHASERLADGAPPEELDRFWTMVGYFNAIRELASAVALFRQDVVQRLSTISAAPRHLEETEPLELSSRADSLALPSLLDQLGVSIGGERQPINAVVATSMFGTGVDVDRLGLMVVNGQPKTTSSYIQATGRVGRSGGGLVVSFYRASRPRDLNHFEFFAAYHSAMHRHVESVTVNPFSPRARDRALGPVAVALLREAAHLLATDGAIVPVNSRWRMQQRLRGAGNFACNAGAMSTARGDADVSMLPSVFEARAQGQPEMRRPTPGEVLDHAASELDRWRHLALRLGGALVYSEPTVVNPPSRPVVLGDLAHTIAETGEAYEDAPTSLREVESTTTFRGWRR